MNRMKNCIYYSIVVLLCYSFSSFGQDKKLSYFDSTGTMPSFTFYQRDGNRFTPDNLDKKHSTVLIYFKTDCPFCEKEAELISRNLAELQHVDFIFISRADTASSRQFAANHHLDNTKGVKFVQDKDRNYYKYYTASYTPSIHIYDNQRK